MIRVAVSGLTGMIGKNLITQHARSGEFKQTVELIGITRRESNTNFLEQVGIPFRCIDYETPESFSGKLEDIDVFLHLAGLTKAITPADYYRVNVDGTARLLEALSRYGRRIEHFVFVSSTSASGPTPHPDRPKTEEDPCAPVSHYGKSKLQAEALVRSCPFSWTIVRLPVVFGPYDYDMLTMFRIAKSGFVILFANRWDPYSYVSAPDVASFLLQACQNERLYRDTYYYCYDTPMSGAEFFPMVRRQVGLPERYRYLRAPRWVSYPARFILDLKNRITGRTTIVNPDKVVELAAVYWMFANQKLKKALNLKSIENRDAVAEMVRWYQDQQLL
jgi:nucleoside-diphosphate-sugar epimerase